MALVSKWQAACIVLPWRPLKADGFLKELQLYPRPVLSLVFLIKYGNAKCVTSPQPTHICASTESSGIFIIITFIMH